MLVTAPAANAITTNELAAQFEAYKKQQQSEFNKIRQENSRLKSENQDLKVQLSDVQDQVDNNTMAVETVSDSYEGVSKTAQWFDKTTIGGYGELHYNNRSTDGGSHKEEVDFHRFVLFFGHEFNDQLRFFSELELEHALVKNDDDNDGEIELEQAFLEYDFTEQTSAKAGIILMPVGTLNETHEPTTFYGVERNDVESKIIPTTWWEAGIGGNMRFDNGISVDAAITSGLDIDSSGDEAFSIRDGRQKVSKQKANDPIFATRVKYTK